jgi:DNA polymerase elongation subunit (family B)
METITFQPCDWIDSDSNFKYVVDIFGRTFDDRVAKVRLTGFKPYFYIRAYDGETEQQVVAALETASTKRLIGLQVKKELKLDAMSGFNGLIPIPVWRLNCPAIWMFKTLARCCVGSRIGSRVVKITDVFESNLPPLLRLFHQQDIYPASPIQFSADEDEPDDDINVDVCYTVHYTEISECSSAKIPLLVGAYDIETYSHSGNFPVSTNATDEIIQIGLSLRTTSDLLKTVKRFVFVSGTVTPSVDESVKFISCKNERDLLDKFQKCIHEENPDVLSGYNTFGFDDGYIADRAELNRLSFDLGRVNTTSWKSDYAKTEKKKFELASGTFAVRYLEMPGRLGIDLLLSVRREQNLDSYKLDNVATTFLRDKVTKVVQLDETHFEIHTKTTRGLFVGNLVRFDIVTNTLNPYKDGVKFTVTDVQPKKFVIETQTSFDNLTPEELSKLEWSFGKDDISVKFMFASHHGTADDRAIVAKYCIQDCDLVLTLIAKLDTIVNARGMADVCRVPIQYIFLRGQGIKIFSAVVYYASKRNQLIVTQERIEGDTSYEGAIVLPPKIGMYLDQPIPVLDFNSLYPSNMIAFNLSPDTLVYVKTFDKNGKKIRQDGPDGKELREYGYTIDEISYDTYNDENVAIGRITCGFVQPKDGDNRTVGVLPLTLDLLLKKRKETRKLMETIEDDSQKSVLNGLQLAYKVVANSVYGQCGARTSPIRKFEVAACTTALGRARIHDAKKVVETEFGATVIYGDSVASYTPIHVKYKDVELTPTIQDLSNFYGENWQPCKEIGKQTKEYCETPDLKTLTDKGWTSVQRVIRHALALHKKMLRITYTSKYAIEACIDVTDDHSMILANGDVIKPSDIKCGDILLNNTHHKDHLLIVTRISQIEYSGYVYDLTTDNHHFQAGDYGLVVHNTDSIFVQFPTKDLAESIELGRRAADKITSLCRKPYKIEYEKTFYPFILFCRKRYVGMMYEDDITKCKRKTMGVALKRRDNAPIVKDIFGGALDILMEHRNIQTAQHFVKDMLVRLMKNEFPLEKFIITKQLRDDYKNPDQIAHRVLADRMAERDPGNAPQVGDRLAYVFVESRKEMKKQGDKIEHIDYVKERKLKPDSEFYITNQIQNPVAQLFALAIEDLEGYKKKINYEKMFSEFIESGLDEEDATLKVLKYKEKELDSLLFTGASYLTRHKTGPLNKYFKT